MYKYMSCHINMDQKRSRGFVTKRLNESYFFLTHD